VEGDSHENDINGRGEERRGRDGNELLLLLLHFFCPFSSVPWRSA